jgi:hypothetical protein
MTPKEKAKELVDKMYGVTDYQAKQSALIAVDEIIKFGNQMGIREPMMYWHEVKKEIEKL